MQPNETRIRVRYAETDQMGIVYHANYLVWMEGGRVAYCKARGFEYKQMELQDGVFLAVAAVCGAALLGLVTRRTGFIVLAMVFGGLIFGRLVSLVLNRGAEGYGPAIRALYAIDSLGLALAVASLMVDESAAT